MQDPWTISQRLLFSPTEREAVFVEIAEELGIDMAEDPPDIAEQRKLMREREQAVLAAQKAHSAKLAKEEQERQARAQRKGKK